MAITTTKGTPFSAAATGSTSTVATFAAPTTASLLYVTDIAGSSDLAGAVLTVKQGTTTIWEVQIGNTIPFDEQFASPLPSVAGASVSVTVTGTSLSKANIAGYYL